MCAAPRADVALDAGLTRVAVVAAAVIRDGRVLAARRVRPAGGWEFPGGKIEPGESAAAAIERECFEELGLRVRAVRHVATACDDRIELHLWQVLPLAGTPSALQDHDELRWLSPDQLAEVAWLPIDRELLGAALALLK